MIASHCHYCQDKSPKSIMFQLVSFNSPLNDPPTSALVHTPNSQICPVLQLVLSEFSPVIMEQLATKVIGSCRATATTDRTQNPTPLQQTHSSTLKLVWASNEVIHPQSFSILVPSSQVRKYQKPYCNPWDPRDFCRLSIRLFFSGFPLLFSLFHSLQLSKCSLPRTLAHTPFSSWNPLSTKPHKEMALTSFKFCLLQNSCLTSSFLSLAIFSIKLPFFLQYFPSPPFAFCNFYHYDFLRKGVTRCPPQQVTAGLNDDNLCEA